MQAERQFEIFANIGESGADIPISAARPFRTPHSTEVVFTFLQTVDCHDRTRHVSQILLRFRNIEVFVDARFRHTSVHRPARFVVGIVDAVKRRFDRLHNIELFIGKIVAVAAQPESFRRAQSDHIKIVFGSNVSDARSTGFHQKSCRESFEWRRLRGVRDATPDDHIERVRQWLAQYRAQYFSVRTKHVRNFPTHTDSSTLRRNMPTQQRGGSHTQQT